MLRACPEKPRPHGHHCIPHPQRNGPMINPLRPIPPTVDIRKSSSTHLVSSVEGTTGA